MVLGRFRVSADTAGSVLDAIEQGFTLSKGIVNVREQTAGAWVSRRFSARFSCDRCGAGLHGADGRISFRSTLRSERARRARGTGA